MMHQIPHIVNILTLHRPLRLDTLTAENEKQNLDTLATLTNINRDNLLTLILQGSGMNHVAELRTSAVFGNYLAALRSIEAGETVVSESPLSISPCSDDAGDHVTCLSCGNCTELSKLQGCTLCKWPICGLKCEIDPEHAENECPIFEQCKITPSSSKAKYGYELRAIAILRCLLLRNKDPTKWNKILLLEPHRDAREKDAAAAYTKVIVTKFIQDRCNLKEEFDADIIDRILGVFCINVFSATNFGRNLTLLYGPSISLIAHSCDPNLNEEYVSTGSKEFVIKLICIKSIKSGEPLTISYLEENLNVILRGFHLKKSFYFYCDCCRCRVDLFDEINFSG